MKFKTAFLLEMRKQRGVYLQSVLFLVLVYAVVLFVFRMGARELDLLEIAKLELLWMYIGSLLLMPLIFGATSGWGLQKEPTRSIEEVLPLSTGVRIGSAFVACLIYCMALLIPLILIVVAANRADSFYEISDLLIRMAMWFGVILAFVVQLSFLSFILGFWRKHMIRAFLFIVTLIAVEFLSFFAFNTWPGYLYYPYEMIGICGVLFLVPTAGLFLLTRISHDLD